MSFFLKNGRVAVVRGADFGGAGAAFVRLNFGTSADLLRDGVARMKRAVTAPGFRVAARADFEPRRSARPLGQHERALSKRAAGTTSHHGHS